MIKESTQFEKISHTRKLPKLTVPNKSLQQIIETD